MTPSFRKMFRMWVSIVLTLRKSSLATSGFVRRFATRRAISASRAVSVSTPTPVASFAFVRR